MKAWLTLATDETCGFCGQLIPASTPALVIEGSGLRRRFRCPDDAGEPVGQSGWIEALPAAAAPAPAAPETWDLTTRRPRRVERVPPPGRPIPLQDLAKDLPFDGRAAAAGKDEA